MTVEEAKNIPEIVDLMLDESITVDARMKLHKRLDELCKLAIEALEQQPFINKPCVSEGVCREDKIQVLDKIRDKIKGEIEQEEFARSVFRHEEKDTAKAEQCTGSIMAYNNVIKLIDKYRAESEDEECNSTVEKSED